MSINERGYFDMFGLPIEYFYVYIIILVISLLVFIFLGYMWNYYLIAELKKMNRKIDDLTDAIGENLNKIANNTSPENRKNTNET